MVVQHNLTAMNSNRMLGVTTSAQAKSTEKLSSGYKINRAADNAAGLSISEKMRKQIRGLTQASSNAQDGISAVQTAEGALNEVHDMLQRMNELAVQSANGTNSETDRQSIQDEINQLTTEIDRVSVTTKFNETYLLQGNGRAVGTSGAGKTLASAKASTTANPPVQQATGVQVTLAEGKEFVAGKVTVGTVTAKSDTDGATLDMDSLKDTLKTELDKLAGGTSTLVLTAQSGDDAGKWKIGTDTALYDAAQLKEMGLNVGSVTGDITLSKTVTKADTLPAGVGVDTNGTLALGNVAIGTELNVTLKVNTDGEMEVKDYDSAYVPEPLKFGLHVGADNSADNKITVEIGSMSASGLGLLAVDGKLHVDGKDSTNADAAIDTIANALQKVSDQRSALGAIQNRLEHTIKNLDNVVENTTAAESQIRDTDMATEMVRYSNNNILAQAGQSMLAQANQSNQGVLSLLG